jgi:hypothetical protein
MIKIAMLSAVLFFSTGTDAVHVAPNAHRVLTPAVDDPPPEPIECPLCGGNPQMHARRMILIEGLQSGFMAAVLRW